jgi:hypothetical protein
LELVLLEEVDDVLELVLLEEVDDDLELVLVEEAVEDLELVLVEELVDVLRNWRLTGPPRYGFRGGLPRRPHFELPLVSDCESAGARFEPIGTNAGDS